MPAPVQLEVYEDQQTVCAVALDGPWELGRQGDREDGPFAEHVQSGRRRLVIASLNERTVSRRHVLLEPLPGGGVRLTNLSDVQPIGLPDGGDLAPRASCELTPPALLLVGTKTVRLQPSEPELPLQTLSGNTLPPPVGPDALASLHPSLSVSLALPGAAADAEGLVRWLQATVGVLHSAAGSPGFFDQAAQAVVDLAGLDAGRVLLLEGERWKEVALGTRSRRSNRPPGPPSRQVLDEVRRQKRTLWQVPAPVADVTASLVGVTAVVAAPILAPTGAIIGALYGDRRQAGPTSFRPISRLEALLVELIAMAVAAGLARLEHEQAAQAARVRFEQFFTPELARHLTARPELLEGRDAEVTVLACDIRGYSRISNRLGSRGTVAWVNDVLECLSECVLAHEGVLVDYVGDQLLAMWGAPVEQPEHARLACRAALDMLGRLPALDARWRQSLGEPLGVGIGVNTGVACVGNVGSRRKFKYGPQGHVVNVASRVEGASKYLRAGLLVTGATHARLSDGFVSRRIGRVRAVNIGEPVELYELALTERPEWPRLQAGYEAALAAFEAEKFGEAAPLLGRLLAEYPGDGPSLVLLGRIINALLQGPDAGHPVWELPGK
jgi:adenylate cyclase